MAVSLGASVHANTTATVTSLATNLTTQSNFGVLLLFATINFAGAATVTVASSSLGSWPQRAAPIIVPSTGGFYYFAVPFTRQLPGEVITLSIAGTSSTFLTIDIVEVAGANNAAPFDNAALPVTQLGADPIALTTNNAQDFLVGAFRMTSVQSPTAGAGWTRISGGNLQLVEYQIVNQTQSNLSATIGTGVGDATACIADAAVAFVPGPPGTFFSNTF
jgi:hypothetical protein